MQHLGGKGRRLSHSSLFWTALLLTLGASQSATVAGDEDRIINRLSKNLAALMTSIKTSAESESPVNRQPAANTDSPNSLTASPESEYSDRKILRVLEKGNSGRTARQAGIEQLPLENMTVENRKNADEILEHVSMFRELPILQFDVEPAVYLYFTQHPEVAVSIWRVLEISKFQMRQTKADEYFAETSDGTSGTIRVLHRGNNQQVILCRGVYKSPLFSKPLQADAIIHLKTQFLKVEDGRSQVRHRAWMYVSFSSKTVEMAAKLISPVSNLIIDRNFQEISLFLNLMSMSMARQPGWVENIASKLEGVEKTRRKELLDLTKDVYISSRKRDARNLYRDSSVIIEDVLKPLHMSNSLVPRSRISGTDPSNPSIKSNRSQIPRIRIVPASRLRTTRD
ncbi:MAG: hypothetical protein IH899_07875 [Planctomycetes bacterium]|nr:hypothetical protein [Planctomycetota bacterium]